MFEICDELGFPESFSRATSVTSLLERRPTPPVAFGSSARPAAAPPLGRRGKKPVSEAKKKIRSEYKQAFEAFKKGETGLRLTKMYLRWDQGHEAAKALSALAPRFASPEAFASAAARVRSEIICMPGLQPAHEPPDFCRDSQRSEYHFLYRVDRDAPRDRDPGVPDFASRWHAPGGDGRHAAARAQATQVRHKRWRHRIDGYEARCYSLPNDFMYLHVFRLLGFDELLSDVEVKFPGHFAPGQLAAVLCDMKLCVPQTYFVLHSSSDWKNFLHRLTCVKYKHQPREYVEGTCEIAYALATTPANEAQVAGVVRRLGFATAKILLRLNGPQGFVAFSKHEFPETLGAPASAPLRVKLEDGEVDLGDIDRKRASDYHLCEEGFGSVGWKRPRLENIHDTGFSSSAAHDDGENCHNTCPSSSSMNDHCDSNHHYRNTSASSSAPYDETDHCQNADFTPCARFNGRDDEESDMSDWEVAAFAKQTLSLERCQRFDGPSLLEEEAADFGHLEQQVMMLGMEVAPVERLVSEEALAGLEDEGLFQFLDDFEDLSQFDQLSCELDGDSAMI